MSKTDECKKIVKKDSLTIKECTELLDGFKIIVNKADELIMSVVDMKSLNKLIRFHSNKKKNDIAAKMILEQLRDYGKRTGKIK